MLPEDGVASLPMYDFAELRAAHDALWAAVADAFGPGLPPTLAHADDVHALWHSPDLAVSQSCGWPLVDELDGRVRTVGAFTYDVPTAGHGATYASRIVTRVGAAGQDPATLTAAVNSDASLSGWLSLVRSFPDLDGVWPGGVAITGAHVESLVAVQAGVADIAAIDGVTYELIRRLRPQLLAGLEVVGNGPTIPCLPLIASADATDEEVAGLRSAFAAAAADDRDALLITGFEPLDADAYESVRAMAVVWQGGRS